MDRGSILAIAIAVAVIAGAGTAGLAMAVSDQPEQTTTDQNRTITVTGSASESAAPDTAVLRLAVEKTAADSNTARAAVANNVSAVTDRLAELGIPDDQVRTTDYRIGERMRPPTDSGESETPTYVARQTIEVHLSDTDAVGETIDAAVAAGATDIQDVRFTLSDETQAELRNTALEAAMSDARVQAETLAGSANLTVTGTQKITTEANPGPVVPYTLQTAAAEDSGTEIDAGPVSVSAQVTVTYTAA
ncbi:SIMPL domain-containing protein [Halodesulfurarchaeum sp. HSR-GB]|uniref:SIMPL domain-containing protein n=1 Tax=Halodesulfurarchaeum sp. HSR-GB TaxID=3074077 RepID=UPI0028671C8C|nr:SIMPL domain-containing protein [Halodesulfurarchaeum sp. HSR-GB]MDR5656601.1 SIMPL domain-containing protein [Halodesulfurarchaeum sp. HSR-GB]